MTTRAYWYPLHVCLPHVGIVYIQFLKGKGWYGEGAMRDLESGFWVQLLAGDAAPELVVHMLFHIWVPPETFQGNHGGFGALVMFPMLG